LSDCAAELCHSNWTLALSSARLLKLHRYAVSTTADMAAFKPDWDGSPENAGLENDGLENDLFLRHRIGAVLELRCR